jgi:hypothetical protein
MKTLTLTQKQLYELLKEAQVEHHKVENLVDGPADGKHHDWAEWYANYIFGKNVDNLEDDTEVLIKELVAEQIIDSDFDELSNW